MPHEDQASEIERIKDVSLQENQLRRRDSIAKINHTFKSILRQTWVDYRAAELKNTVDKNAAVLLYEQTAQTIDDKHTQKTRENEHAYEKEIAKVERRFHDELREVTHTYASVYQIRSHKTNEARTLYEEACNNAWRIYDNSVRQARFLTKEASHKAHAEAIKERDTERERLQVGSRELLKTSYEMVAERIGLDGVTPDIATYVSRDTPYDSIQPLIGYMDLKQALYEGTKNPEGSDLIRHFYDVTSDDPTIDVAILKEAVQSLDLGASSQIFKHRCVFMAPPLSPEERTLYIDFSGETLVTFTVVSPYGEILSKPYHVKTETVGQTPESYTQEDSRRDYIVEHTADFVRKLYYCNKATAFDAFSYLMASTNGFKAHVIKTIAASNRSLKRPEGIGDIKLTKQHLGRSRDATACTFDETPFHHANEAYHTLASAIDARYYAKCKALDKTSAEAILLEQDMCRKAEAIYHLACEEIERELEWDELAAEISVHEKAFQYFSNPDSCTAKVGQKTSDVGVINSEPASFVAVSKQVNNPLFFSANKILGKPKGNPCQLPRIPEEVLDDADIEVCMIMGSKSLT